MRQERGRREFARYSPVKVGDELDVKIEHVGAKGDGIAKKDGFVLFVPGTKQGDQVKIRVTRVLAKVGFAEVTGKGEAGSEETSEQEETQVDSSESPETEEEFAGEDTENFGEEDQ